MIVQLEDAKAKKPEASQNHPAGRLTRAGQTGDGSPVATEPATRRGGINLDALRSELDEYFEIVKTFRTLDSDEVLLHLAGMSARAAEIRSHLVRLERHATVGGAQAFRTKEIDPFIELLNLQFKIFSRLISVHALDYEISKGGT